MASPEGTIPARRTIHALLVEDNPDDAMIVRRLLQRYSEFGDRRDVVFRQAATLEGALEALRSTRVDVVLLDVNLPDNRDLAALHELRRERADLAILVLTGMSGTELAAKAVELGAQDFLNKDQLSAEGLSRAIRFALERVRRQNAELRIARWGHERRAAGAAQRLLFPHRPPRLRGVELAGRCSAVNPTAGIYYDFVRLRDGSLCLVLADARGPSLETALMMAGLRRVVRTAAGIVDNLSILLSLANQAVAEDARDGTFVTAALAVLDIRRGKLYTATAGQPVFLVRPHAIEQLSGSGLPLGLNRSLIPTGPAVPLTCGDIVVLMCLEVLMAGLVLSRQSGNATLDLIQQMRNDSPQKIIDAVFQRISTDPQIAPHDMAMVCAKLTERR